MKKTLVFFFFVMSYVSHSQDVQFRECLGCDSGLTGGSYTYTGAQVFPADGVADDYGPRRFGDNWHGGVDYNDPNSNDKGDLILAINGGDLEGELTGSGLKYLVIRTTAPALDYSYGYLHLFDNNTAPAGRPLQFGGTYLAEMLPPFNMNNAVIFIINGDTSAISTVIGQVAFNGDTLTTVSGVGAGDPIGSVGRSGLLVDAPHLHLTMIRHMDIADDARHDISAKDPLQHVNYDMPMYRIQVRSPSDTSNVVLNYSSGSSVSPIAIRPEILGETRGTKRYSAIYDINEVEISIGTRQTDGSINFNLVQGPREDAYISQGGRLNTNVVNVTRGSFGNWTTTGVNSFAYNDPGGEPWDDFHFSDFVHRLDKNDIQGDGVVQTASCPQDMLYNDGLYYLQTRITRSNGNILYGPTDAMGIYQPEIFVLDNFQPYVEQVVVSNNGKIIYDNSWDCNGCGGISFTNSSWNESINLQDILLYGFEFEVITSEPMKSLVLEVPTSSGSNIVPWLTSVSGNSTTFNFFSLNSNLLLESTIEMYFEGEDHNGNSVLELQGQESNPCVTLPIRTPAGWPPSSLMPGTDEVHYFTLNCGANRPSNRPAQSSLSVISDACFQDIIVSGQVLIDGLSWEVSHASGSNTQDGEIIITPGAGVPPYSYLWDNGETGSELKELNPGTYCVTVSDAFCCEEEYCIEVVECELVLDIELFDWSEPSSCETNDGYLGLPPWSSISGTPPFIWYWEDELGNNPDSCNSFSYACIKNLKAGLYYLTVTDANGCADSIVIDLPGSSSPIVESLVYPSCEDGDVGFIFLLAYNLNFFDYYHFVWSVGDTTFNALDSERSNLAPGEYCIEVWTSDWSCSTVHCVIVDSLAPQLPLGINVLSVKESCPLQPTGEIEVEIVGGVEWGPFTYEIEWSTGNQQVTSLTGLSGGTYSMSVTDYCDAKAVETIVIDEYPSVILELEAFPDCPGLGDINLSISGGNPPYQILWNTGAVTEDLTDINSGTYVVTVTDSNECYYSESVVLQNYPEIIVTSDRQNTCSGVEVGFIDLDISGGTPPIEIAWSNGSTSNVINDLAAGSYSVTLTDDRGCMKILNFQISIVNPTQTHDGNCLFTFDCFGVSLPELTYSGTQGDSIDANDCRLLYTICYDDFFEGGSQIIDFDELDTYFVDYEFPDEFGCPIIEEWCVGYDRVQGTTDDQFYRTHIGTLISTDVFGDDPERDCQNCWYIEYCEYLSLPFDEFPFLDDRIRVITIDDKWLIGPVLTNEDKPCPTQGNRCFIQVFCNVEANEQGNGPLSNFWFSQCMEDFWCSEPHDAIAEQLGICLTPPSLNVILNSDAIDSPNPISEINFGTLRSKNQIESPKEEDQLLINISPNPFLNELAIQFLGGNIYPDEIDLVLFDTKGLKVFESKLINPDRKEWMSFKIDASIPVGFYYVRVSSGDSKFAVKKLIKQ